MDYLALQNGSDIRGVAIDGEKKANLDETSVKATGRAFALWLKERLNRDTGLRVSIGRDSRLTGEKLAGWFAAGLMKEGVEVVNFNLASTPAMFMSTVREGWMFDGAVMVTASHLPFDRNGFKLFTASGGLEKADIKAILTAAAEIGADVCGEAPAEERDFISVYAADMVDFIRRSVNAENYERPLEGMHIVVDAGNGAGGFFADKVLEPLGANTAGSLFLEPDGSFPNHAPNPENAEAMKAISDAVLKNRADLGLIFDTDVDRAAAVTADGREINRNGLIALMSAIVLREHPNSVIVTDSITSTGLKEFIEGCGGVHRRFKRGYRNVINEAIRLNNEGTESHLAIETSGHGALKENYFLDDGAYLMAKLLIEAARCRTKGKGIETLIENLREPLEAREYRIKLLCDDFAAYGKKVLEDVSTYAETKSDWRVEPENYEGIRVNVDKHGGWFLLRMSLHDPLMPLNIESDREGGVSAIAGEVYEALKCFDGLDTSIIAAGIC